MFNTRGWFRTEVSIPGCVDGGHGGRIMMGVVDRRCDLGIWAEEERKVQNVVPFWINVRNVGSCSDGR